MVRLAVITAALAASAMAGFNNHKTITDLINQVSKTEDAVTAPVDMWVDQPLDHTDAANKKTWKQRYHFNNAWFKGAGSPVFVYINGENVADPASTTSPSYFMNELAQ
ncbi:hypothetical protein As57867_012712, partial [Aphanomyces stellatus]